VADKDRTDKKSVLVTEDKTGGPSNWTKEETDAFLSTMKKRYARCVESEKDNRRDSLEDLEFLDAGNGTRTRRSAGLKGSVPA